VKDILPEVVDWTGRGERVAIGMVVGVSRSAPRPLGAKMAVSESGLIIGAVSGGCVEGAVVEIAERILRDRSGPELHHFGIADDEAWEVGLPCGGEIDVWVEEFEPRPFLDVAVAGGRAA
jgi:xanthine dehydrogenase accessory factor